jgi:hypothetical protein
MEASNNNLRLDLQGIVGYNSSTLIAPPQLMIIIRAPYSRNSLVSVRMTLQGLLSALQYLFLNTSWSLG